MKAPLVPFVAALISLPLQQSAPAMEPARVQGIVLRTDGRTPIPGARILMTRQSPGGSGDYGTLSGPDGRFLLKDIVPGRYLLTAKISGYLPAEYGARRPGRPGTALELTSGQTLDNLAIPMTAGSVISGHVYDDTGRPMSEVFVQAIQPRYDPQGQRIPHMLMNTRTNDLGEYRLYWAAPGTYYLAATATSFSTPMERNTVVNEQYSGSEEVFLPTFYPNSVDVSQATTLTVEPGSEIRAIDFVLTRHQTVHVRGEVMDTMNAALPPRLNVSIHSKDDGWINLSNGFVVATNPKGEFDFRSVPPGSYTIFANAPPGPAGPSKAAKFNVNVGNKNVTDLRIPLEPIPTITIRSRFESGTNPRRVSLTFTAIEGAGRSAAGLADSETRVPLPDPGEYRITLGSGGEAGFFIRSARVGSRDVLRDGIDTSAGSPEPLDIVVASSTSVVEGVVRNERGDAAAGAQVVLIPTLDRRARVDLFRQAVTDQRGHFNLRGAAPGDYKLFAWDDIEPYIYFDPIFLQQYEILGLPIHVQENQSATTNLNLIR